jgi:hypothetical protein
MIYTNTITNNKISPNLNKPKTFAPVNYWRILNKNADKIHKNISARKYVQKPWQMQKPWRIQKHWRI